MDRVNLEEWQMRHNLGKGKHEALKENKKREKMEKKKQETLEKEKKQREREPLWYCNLITKYPRRAFGITLGLHIGMAVLTGILFGAGYDIIPVYMDDLPVHLHDEPWQARVYAWLERNKFPEHYERISDGAYQTQGSPLGNIDINYESKDGSTVFTKANLQKMKTVEDKLMAVSGFDAWCRLDIITRQCAPPTSILRYFDGTYAAIDPVFNDPNYDNIITVLYNAYTNPDTSVEFRFFLGTSASITQTAAFSPITRSVIQFGFPVQEYEDDELGYRREAGKWTHNNMEPILEDFKDDNSDVLDVSYRSQVMWFYFTRAQAFVDCFWAGGSMGFIFLVVLFHTRSLWLAGFSVLSVITSFVITNLIYNLVFQFKYLGFFHVLSLFIILGIGADNFFVFYDTWRNAGIYKYPSLAHRLSDTYRKSALAMLFTSLTTSVAFYSNAITAILATRSFGVFAGTAVVVNYISVIIYFPTVVVMYHLYFENWQWPCIACCLRRCGSNHKSENSYTESSSNGRDDRRVDEKKIAYHKNGTYNNDYEMEPRRNGQAVHVKADYQNGYGYGNYGFQDSWRDPHTTGVSLPRYYTQDGFIIAGPPPPRVGNGYHPETGYKNGGYLYDNHMTGNGSYPNGGNMVEYKGTNYQKGINNKDTNYSGSDSRSSRMAGRTGKKKPLMTRFFGNYYYKFITNKVIRWIILLVMAGVLGFFIYQVTKLEADNEEFQVLPDGHVYEVSRVRRLESFVSSYGDETLELYIIWGVKKNDMSICAFTEPECDGLQVYDETFDINTAENQLALKTFCETLENMNDEQAQKMRLRKNEFTGKYEIHCFLQTLENYLAPESTAANPLTVPFTRDNVLQFMQDRPQFYNASLFGTEFKDYLGIPISYWLSEKHTYAITDDFYDFDPLIGEGKNNFSQKVNNNQDKYYGNFIRHVAIRVNITIKFRLLGYVDDKYYGNFIRYVAIKVNTTIKFRILVYVDDKYYGNFIRHVAIRVNITIKFRLLGYVDDKYYGNFIRYVAIKVNTTLKFRILDYVDAKYYGNFIRYVAIKVNTTIKFRLLGYVEGIPIRDAWEDFMNDQLANMPVGLKNGFQTDVRFRWHSKRSEQLLVQNAIYGVVIGITLAFPILIIATGNFVVGTLATFSLCCCTVCVIGVIPLGGWKLGYLESLNTCIVVGLSVDYVVHLAQAYSHSYHPDRLSRVRDMLEEMGTSVLFGAITSLGAAMFMFFTIITFFNQFAAFMFATVGFSLLFSLLMFTTLMGIIGPQNEFGSLKACYRKCRHGNDESEARKGHHDNERNGSRNHRHGQRPYRYY